MKCLCVVLSLALLSCSSLSPVDSLPVSSPVEEKPQTKENELKSILQNSIEQGRELENLKALFQVLKTTSGNLDPLMQSFDERLTKYETELKAAHKLSSEQSSEIEQLRKDFNDYRKTVKLNRLRDGLIIGGACTLGGFIVGLLIGLFAK